MKFSIIGCGRLGTHLAVFLSENGFSPAGFYSRTPASAVKILDAVGKGNLASSAREAAQMASLVFLTTPDTQIEPVCQEIARQNGFDENSIVLHLSGALASEVLSSAAQKGAATGSVHPLQAFVPYQSGQESPFQDIHMSIEGEKRAIEAAQKIVTALGAKEFVMPTEAKILYHAAAVTASNYLVTLIHGALQMMGQTGLGSGQAYNVLEPLIHGSLNNIKTRGTIQGLTGPIARGDQVIVARHMEKMKEQLPETLNLYRILGQYTLDLARQGKGLEPEAEKALTSLLGIS